MSYIGNNLQVAYPSYRIIDDISSGFNGVLKTFALRVAGSTPIPFPINPQQCLLSVNNIVQKPDSTGASGFTLTGSNIVFATAPTAGWSFFGTVLAGADYVNVGANFPSGTAEVPSVTFDASTGTGLFLASSNVLGITTGGVQRLVVNSSGFVGIGTTSPSQALSVVGSILSSGAGTNYVASSSNGVTTSYLITDASGSNLQVDGAWPIRFTTNSSERARIDSSGNVGIGTSSPAYRLDVAGEIRSTGGINALRLENSSNAAVYAVFTRPNQQYTLALNSDNNGARTFDLYDNTNAHFVDQYLQGASGYRRFFTDGAERARIDSSGRLLVGTSSTSQAATILIQGNSSVGTTGAGILKLARGEATPTSGLNIGELRFTDSGHTSAATIECQRDGGTWTSGSSQPTRLAFSTTADGAASPTEAMRIDNQRNILAGGATDANVGSGVGIKILSSARMQLGVTDSTDSSIGYSMYSTGAAAYRFYVGFGGTIYATSTTISAISDSRLKENIKDLDVGLDAILALKPRKFDWKEGFGNTGKDIRGFIAQEVEEIFPDLIDEWEKGENHPEGEEPYKSVRQDLIPVLVKAIQEQQVMIAELQTEVAALKGA